MMLAPGLSSARIPMHVRLFASLGLAFAASPLLLREVKQNLSDISEDVRVILILTETMRGVLIGLMARCFFMALQFAATAIANFIGLAGIPGIPLEEADTGSPLATLASTAAMTLVFASGLHMELLRAVLESYDVMPLGEPIRAATLISSLLNTISQTWLLALRLAGPFLLYGIIVNLALGIGNRFAQQISVYQATTGAVMLGGFLLLYLIWSDWSLVFLDAYRSWLLAGGF